MAEKRIIDGHEYTVGDPGLLQFQELAAVLAPVLAGVTGAGLAFDKIIPILTAANIRKVSEILGSCSRVTLSDRAPELTAQFQNVHFAGRYATYVKWLKFALEVTFRPLFAELIGDLVTAPQPSPETASA
jgi:hypothetical protein